MNEKNSVDNRKEENELGSRKEGRLGMNVWWVLIVVSCAFLAFSLLAMSNPGMVLETALNGYAGSTVDLEQMDNAGREFLEMAMIKPLWEGLWVFIFGIFIALKLKQKKEYAWTLGIMWSAMLLMYGVIQGGYEVAILSWPGPCFQTYLFLIFGMIPLVCLLMTRRD